MADCTVSAPDTVHAISDPGDETTRRFRYQWTYAAIICCMLLDEGEDVGEVFCEHHEDILIKYVNGAFQGLQIKTRQSDQNVWKTNDDGVRGACIRFAKLESLFPGRFRAYRFLTNHPFFASGNGNDFRYVLQTIKMATSLDVIPNTIKVFLNRIADEAHCTMALAFTALAKTDADDSLPKLPDIETRLVTDLTGVWTRAMDCSYATVLRAARNLASECCRASSLAHQDVLPAYLPAIADPVGTELTARISAKRIDRSRVLEILEYGVNETATLDGDPETFVEPGIGKKDLLLKKLDAGGFSAVTLNAALDLRDKADYLGIVWVKKHGREAGLQHYNHVRSLVLHDAGTAFEVTKNADLLFGFNMLSNLRSLFQQRRVDGSQLYECSNEHLEGFAYSLTSECKVQWSLYRPWEDE